MTGEPGNQRATGARLPPEDALQPAVDAAIEKLMARQATEMRAVGAEMQERLAAEPQRDDARPPQPPSAPPPLPPVAALPSGDAARLAAERPLVRSRRAATIVAAILVLLLLAGIAGAVSLLVADRRAQREMLVAAPPVRAATAAPATATPLLAAPAAAPPTTAPGTTAPAATLPAGTRVPTPVAAATSIPPPAVAAAPSPPSTAVATATPVPTSTPSTARAASAPAPATPQPTAAAPVASSPAVLAQRVVAAESALRRGQFEAVLNYGNGVRTTATVTFDYGTATQPQRLHVTTVYTSPTGSQTSERILVGDRAWDRQPDGRWVAMPEQEGVWGRVQPFLPQADRAQAPDLRNEASGASLHWIAAAQDITVLVDSASGIPRELRQVNRTTGATLVVTYRGWNTPVDITPPAGT